MSLATGRYQLANAFKVLKAEWDATENAWRDIVRQAFGEKHFEPLEIRQSAVLTAMDRFDQVLTKMKQDCS
jgi:hypothetical protein